jgi:hypothetical protein
MRWLIGWLDGEFTNLEREELIQSLSDMVMEGHIINLQKIRQNYLSYFLKIHHFWWIFKYNDTI